VARYADACNLFAAAQSEVARKLDVLRRHCEAESRDYDTIEKTVLYVAGDPLADPKAFLADMDGYATLGITTVILMPNGDPVEFTRRVGTDLGAVAGVGA
jgi:hypothetical protein